MLPISDIKIPFSSLIFITYSEKMNYILVKVLHDQKNFYCNGCYS